MKKKIFALLVLLAAAVTSAWAEEITIGDPTSTTTNSSLPSYSLYDYSLSQQIYTADEIGTSGTINALTMWLMNSSSYPRNYNIYMKEVSQSSFADGNAWVSMAESNLVATATLSNGITAPVETTFTLTTPFEYSGTGNLVICFQDVTGQWSSGVASVVMTTSGHQAIYAYRDDSLYDPTSPGVTGSFATKDSEGVKSVVKFDISASGFELTVGTTEYGTITLTNAAGEEITSAAEGDVVTVSVTPDEGYVVKGVTGQWYASWNIAAAPKRHRAPALLNAISLTPVEGAENQWSFTMERANAEISATYKKLLSNTDITISAIDDVTYNGQEQKPAVVVKDGETTLVEGTDYTISYTNNVNACPADAEEDAPTVTITAVATSEKYAGDTLVNFTILKAAGSISYAVKQMEKALGDAKFINPLTIVGDGTVTYTLSGDEVAEVNAETGEVKLTDAPGVFAVTATVEDGANYTYETPTASYAVSVALPIDEPFVTEDEDPAIVANKLALLTALDKAKAYDLEQLTVATATALAEAIAKGEEMLQSKTATVPEIDAARRAVLLAIDNIAYKPTTADAAEKAVPEGWENMIVNGNFATDDVSSFFMVEPGKGLQPAAIENGADQDEWHAAVVRSQDNPAQDWDTQFFIRANTPLPVGTKIHVEFDYRSDVQGASDTQSHKEPQQYIHWACVGSPTFKEEWQHWSYDGTVSGDMTDSFQTIAFNLAKNKVATTFYFDNIVFWAQKPAPVEIEWQDVIKNGTMEGTDVSNFVAKVYPSTDIVACALTAGAGNSGSKGIKIESPAKVDNPWDSQFWIVLPFAVTDAKMKLEFDYKADKAVTVDMQNHDAPGSYKGNLGSVGFTTGWQTFSKELTMTGSSIAFNLSMDEAVTYFFDNVKLYLDKTLIATGVDAVKTVKNDGQVYDLQGRRVDKPNKGLYIKNGKKIVIK